MSLGLASIFFFSCSFFFCRDCALFGLWLCHIHFQFLDFRLVSLLVLNNNASKTVLLKCHNNVSYNPHYIANVHVT